ncbi:MAG TPA: SDR family oxidoreductase [Steroidobacteraceae bacterium]|nr:SDR family oxidoreductase [Steroidobacteraceae bacterium]
MKNEQGGVLVLGGTGGLGSAIVRRLAADWDYVEFTYRVDAPEEELSRATALIEELAGVTSIASHPLQYTDERALGELVRAVHGRSGGLRAVVNAVGVHIPQQYVSQLKPEQWREVVPVELMGFIALVRQVLPVLRETRGSIVNVGSVATRWFVVGDALSAVPKAGAEALCRAVAKEEGRYGVRANTVAPGIMEVGIGRKVMDSTYDEEVWEQTKRRTPLRRFGRGEDVAGAVAFLCSSEASFITGQTIIADGGLHL